MSYEAKELKVNDNLILVTPYGKIEVVVTNQKLVVHAFDYRQCFHSPYFGTTIDTLELRPKRETV